MVCTKVKPVPAGHCIGGAGHHILKMYDCDGHFNGYQILQWQPGAKKWCIPGNVASGNDIPWERIEYWEYFCECPIPEYDSELRRIAVERMQNDAVNLSRHDWLKKHDLL